MKLSETDFPMARSKLMKKELPSKDVPKTLLKTFKRQSKQTSYLDDSTKELSPRKKAKLSTNETTAENLESDMQIDCLNESKHTEPSFPESFASLDSVPVSTLQKGTKPIQALLAKNIGNKVTLTNQLPPSTGRSTPAVEKPVISSPEANSVKPALTCHTSTKGPLQMVYKMPCGQWLPIDLHSSSVKIQMQPVVDPKTGEKIMQQVLILPKNFVIQHKEGKAIAKETPPLQQKGTEQHCSSFPQTTNVNSSLASVLVNPTGTVSTQLLSTVFNKTITPLSNMSSARPQPLSSVTSVSNLLTPPVKTSQSEAGKVKNAVSAATFPLPNASSTISLTSQPVLSGATLNGSTSPGSSLNCFAQQPADSSETKQELKTVCIRDSQSILVRTRGGNTGVVKVQTNPDQNSPNTLSSSSIFTFAPQLQAFLMPKSTTSSSSAFSPVAGMTTTSSLPPFGQTPSSISIPASFNPSVGKNLKLTLGHPTSSGNLGHMIDKTSHMPPSPLKSSVSSSALLPSTTSSSVSVISISTGNFGQSNGNVIHTPTKQQQVDYITKSCPVTRSEATVATNGDVTSGTPVQKLMLVSAPSVLSSGSGTAVNVTPAPTSTGISAQKLVFINAPVPSGTSTPTVVAESLKQTLPPSLNKTYVKTPEQSQIVLIPSTVGAPIKINSSPTVSQIKDVKIGLNIGQAIVNTSGTVPAIPPINIMQNVIPKGEDKSSKGYVLPLSTSGNSIPVSSNFVSQNITPVNESVVSATRAVNMFSVTGANVSLGSLSVTSTSASVGTRPPVLVSGNDTSSRIMPILSNRLCTSNLGNTVAISTVKTGHLASSVLISATQPTVSPKCLTSALQIPVTVALPTTPVTASPKIVNTVQHSATVPGATCSLSKRQSRTSLQFQSPGISATVPTNVNANKPQTELSSLSPSPGKIINISNLASLPNQQMPPAVVKSTPNYSSAPGGSASHTATTPSNVTNLVGSQFSEPCIQQKIVINTSTPLAPGTQIMISGTRFIVPPQGLGAGSHVLLISTNPKYGPPLVLNSSQGIQPTPVDNPAQKITLASNNSLSGQPIKHSMKSSTKIVNSFGNASSLPTVHTTPQIVNTTAKVSVLPPAPTVSLTSVIKSPPATLLAKTSLVSAICSSNTPLPSNTSVFHLDTSVKKLLVSPEGAILNTINTPASKVSSLSSSLSQIVVSASRNPASVFPALQSSGLEKPDTAAS